MTSYGLRSLSPKDPAYLGRYRGDPWQRDAAYHQGTVWSWLLGPFARAHYRVHGDARAGPVLPRARSRNISKWLPGLGQRGLRW